MPFPNGYSYVHTFDIIPNRITGVSDLTNFDLLISGTFPDLATVAHGGHVTNANGYDIIFTQDATGVIPMHWEVELYTATTGVVDYWIKVPVVSHIGFTRIFMWFGNSSVTTDQSTPTQVWDANYKAVWHLPNGTTLGLHDSTTNANNITNHGAAAAAGKIDGAAIFDGVANYATAPLDLSATTVITVSFWLNSTTTGDGENFALEFTSNYTSSTGGWIVDVNSNLFSGNAVAALKGNIGTDSVRFLRPATGSWHKWDIVFNKNGSPGQETVYLDGALVSTLANSTAANNNDFASDTLYFMSRAGASNFLAGTIDEVRVSNIQRSAAFLNAEYLNQYDPANFYIIDKDDALLQIAAGQSLSGTVGAQFLKNCTPGSTIIAWVDAGGESASVVVSDTFGNSYNHGCETNSTLGEWHVVGFYAINSAGSMPSTVAAAYTPPTSAPIGICAAEYQNIGIYTQGAADMGLINATITGPDGSPHAEQTYTMPLADSMISSFIGTAQPGFTVINSFLANNGDQVVIFNGLIGPLATADCVMFQRFVKGPGTATSQLQAMSTHSSITVGAMCFSKPLARPNNLSSQFAIQPGMGFSANSAAFPSDGSTLLQGTTAWSQRNIRCNLPYVQKINAVLLVAVIQNNFDPILNVFDDYGNTYTLIFADSSQGSTAAVYICEAITFLPPANTPFIVKCPISIAGGSFPNSTYQAPGMALAEYDLSLGGTPGGVGFLSQSGGGPVQINTNTLTVLKNTLLFAVTAVSVADSPDTQVFTPRESYTIESQWTEKIDPAQDPTTNSPRWAVFCTMDKFAPSSAAFDAEIIALTAGSLGMVLVSVPVAPLTLACPVVTAGSVGVPFTASLIVGGGVRPYTFVITGLPPGLSYDATTGVISGTPSAVGNYSYTVTVTDAIGETLTVMCSINITGVVPPPFCILVPVVTPQPSLVAYNEPLENQGS